MDNETALAEFELYLRRRYPERSTAKHYLSDLRQFRKVCAKPWAEVTPQDIDAFVDYGQQRGWKPMTLTRRVTALKTFFEFWAVESNTLERPNPVQPWRHAPKRGQRLPRDLPDEVLEQLWFTLMLRGGLRVGEVVALNRGDVLTSATESQPARLRVLGKGHKERIIYLSADAYAVVARWLVLRPSRPEAPLCPNARAERMTVNGLQERLRHYGQKAKVHVTCHQLRHTFARQMVEHDLPVTTLSKLLGHECLSTTQVYVSDADPQVRQDYTAAMTQWDEPPSPDSAEATPASQPPSPPPSPPSTDASPQANLAASAPQPDLANTWAKRLPGVAPPSHGPLGARNPSAPPSTDAPGRAAAGRYRPP